MPTSPDKNPYDAPHASNEAERPRRRFSWLVFVLMLFLGMFFMGFLLFGSMSPTTTAVPVQQPIPLNPSE